jgi:hypothetical protein
MFVSKCHSSKETIFTRQQKYVICQINKDTNSYYTTPICIYLYIINNALNEAEDAELRNGLLLIPYSINIFFMFYYDKQDFHV